MTRLPERTCLRCGVACHGKVCQDCRETDPTWFALTGLYHAKNQTIKGTSISPERQKR